MVALGCHHRGRLAPRYASFLPSAVGTRFWPRALSVRTASVARKAGPVKGSDVPRLNIGIFGAMNAGKSLLMNRITRQETSIVDSTPGTTADTKIALFELHDVGPVKLFDTAGVDEAGDLGAKKRAKTLSSLKESDLAVVVVDAAKVLTDSRLGPERELLEAAARHGVLPLLVVNVRKGQHVSSAAVSAARDELCRDLGAMVTQGAVPRDGVARYAPSDFTDAPVLLIDLLEDPRAVARVAEFLELNARRVRTFMPRALPERYLRHDAGIFLNVPMDAETPSMRLLRPQALVQEEAIRHWATTVAFRMDLAAARGADEEARTAERRRFQRALQASIAACPAEAPKLLITDSQAMDVVHPWTLDEATGQPLIDVTTFSICMMHRMSGAQLPRFAAGMRKFRALRPGDRILMAEACNHNRITDGSAVPQPWRLSPTAQAPSRCPNPHGPCAPHCPSPGFSVQRHRHGADSQYGRRPVRRGYHRPRLWPRVSCPRQGPGQLRPHCALWRLHDRPPEDARAPVRRPGSRRAHHELRTCDVLCVQRTRCPEAGAGAMGGLRGSGRLARERVGCLESMAAGIAPQSAHVLHPP